MATKHVKIKISANGDITVNPVKVTIRRSAGDVVVWKSVPSSKPFVVCFPFISPFRERHFHKGRNNSGPAVYGPRLGEVETFYKYNVEVNGRVLDPGIIVRA